MITDNSWTSGGNSWESITNTRVWGGTTTTITELFENGVEVSLTNNTKKTFLGGGWDDTEICTNFLDGKTTVNHSHG